MRNIVYRLIPLLCYLLGIFTNVIVVESKASTAPFSRRSSKSLSSQQLIVDASSSSSSSSSSLSSTSRKQSATINGIRNFASSAMAAACSKTLLAPFDTIKTIQQQSLNAASGKALTLKQAANVATSRPGGVLELYAGLGVSAIGAMPSVGLYFGVYSYAKEKIGPFVQNRLGKDEDCVDGLSKAGVRSLTVATSAAIGNTIASFSRVPYEVVKQKLQTGEYSSTFGALKHMCANGGLRSFFPMGGVAIQMYRDIPYAIVTLLTYECLRDHWVNKNEELSLKDGQEAKKVAPWKDMIAGGVAGGMGSFMTNPMDVIKTRLQVNSELYSGNVWVCASRTLEEGGPSAFLRGSVPRLIHKVPANACFFVFYEFFRRVLGAEDVGKA
uniref:Mitochondrial carrier protein n=1 Tax=Chaetoceros debilis TaxID=122233 RepID=A0A7S3V944_9STRA